MGLCGGAVPTLCGGVVPTIRTIHSILFHLGNDFSVGHECGRLHTRCPDCFQTDVRQPNVRTPNPSADLIHYPRLADKMEVSVNAVTLTVSTRRALSVMFSIAQATGSQGTRLTQAPTLTLTLTLTTLTTLTLMMNPVWCA